MIRLRSEPEYRLGSMGVGAMVTMREGIKEKKKEEGVYNRRREQRRGGGRVLLQERERRRKEKKAKTAGRNGRVSAAKEGKVACPFSQTLDF